jgi:hypothetical protein
VLRLQRLDVLASLAGFEALLASVRPVAGRVSTSPSACRAPSSTTWRWAPTPDEVIAEVHQPLPHAHARGRR